MPKKQYDVRLSEDEINRLKQIIHNGSKASAKTILHANVLLNTNDNDPERKKSDRDLAEIFGISPTTVNQIRRAYATLGIEATLNRKTRLTAPILSKITGDFEAHVVAMALGPTPKGRAKWTLRLLAEHCLANQYIVSISHTAIGEMLNSNQVKPHLSKYWCIPKENDAAFVANMEDILGIYQKPYDSRYPVICMDEKPVQLLDEIRNRIEAKPLRIDPDTALPKPGEVEKIDAEYIRCGTASIFMFTEPLGGWRHTVALKSRKKGDFALMMREIYERYYFDVEQITLVADNLNTHNKTSFYEAFPAHVAYELSQKYNFHYTPKHGSWLNIAETELSSLSTQCLGKQRINSVVELNEILSAWEVDRNTRQKGVNWQFTAEDARIKLKRLYPIPLFE
jgi:predicted DNA-binding protein